MSINWIYKCRLIAATQKIPNCVNTVLNKGNIYVLNNYLINILLGKKYEVTSQIGNHEQ